MDSDEEKEFRRRDKFRRERFPPPPGIMRREGLPRGYWRGPPPSRGQPRHSMRGSFYHSSDNRPSYGHYDPTARKRPRLLDPSSSLRNESGIMPRIETSCDGFQPEKLTFKAFLSTQDDSITDEEAAHKYSEYKLEFRRQQLNSFFTNNKDCEWFKLKYHPVENKAKNEKVQQRIKRRLEIYQEMKEKGQLDDISLSAEHEESIIRLVDKIVMILDGASEEDIKALETQSDGMNLHKSLFVRSLEPTITKAELEEVCSRFPGFQRLCFSDPDPAKGWSRKAWITFKDNAKIKEICYNLNNTKVHEKDLECFINKPLSQRIRSVSSINYDQKIMRNDIKLLAKLTKNLDSRHDLWSGSENTNLENIHEYLIEEASAEEDELLQRSSACDSQDTLTTSSEREIIKDMDSAKVLDRLVLYLRLVHSIDFYNSSQYSNEDEMPNRLGILHVREQFDSSKRLTEEEISKVCEDREKSFEGFLKQSVLLGDDELTKLGFKVENDEIEKFVSLNCQEVSKDKWLCPLSGKKFKAPDFVKKHIHNKFPEKIEEVKMKTQFYNNYLRDPKRPELPEKPKDTERQPPKPNLIDPPDEVDDGPPAISHSRLDRKRGIQERLGSLGNSIRVTQSVPDPRQIVDYSDVDMMGGLSP